MHWSRVVKTISLHFIFWLMVIFYFAWGFLSVEGLAAWCGQPWAGGQSYPQYDYLHRLVLGEDGRRRLARVSFAAHFDSLMFGRRGIPRPPDEAALNPYRRRFAAHFAGERHHRLVERRQLRAVP